MALPILMQIPYSENGDLIRVFGANEAAGASHFIAAGYEEHRHTTFNAAQYLANYSDLQQAFGGDLEAATRHYITNGFFEHRDDAPHAAAADFLI